MPTRRTSTPFVIPHRLPVLTSDNRSTYPQWHAYVNRVYNGSVLQPCDLNTFTWFYRTAPFVSALGPTTKAPLRTWRPGIQFVEREAFVLPGMNPAIGFFVYRPNLTPTWTPNDARFEGMPIRRVSSTASRKDHLAAVLWHARGTGRWFDRQDEGVHRTARVPLATYAVPTETENDTVAEQPLRRVQVERTDKGGIAFTPVDDDTRWSTSHQWTTGLTRRQHIRHDRPPVWFTETEIKIATLLQTGTDQEVRRYLESLSSEEAHALLNTWLPVQEWSASSEYPVSPLAHGLHTEHGRHSLTTPLGLAAAMGRVYVTHLFLQQGANLYAKCPAWCVPG